MTCCTVCDHQMESRCKRGEGASLSFQTAYPAVCVHQEERLWGVGHSWGSWLLHFLYQTHLLFCTFLRCCWEKVLPCLLDYPCACAVGDGRSRGAGFSHTAARVLRGSTEFSVGPTIRERRDSRAHHQTFQITWSTGQQFTFHILVHKESCYGKLKYILFYLRSTKVM